MSKEAPRQGIPFERPKNRKKPTKKPTKKPSSPVGAIATGEEKTGQQQKERKEKVSQKEMAIPEAVSRRMVSRTIVLSGTPLLMALFTFVGSYFIIVNELFPLPNQAVLLVSMGFFGLSAIGLSYGIFSASWEEENAGSLLGLQEFTTNFGRTTEAWRSAKKNRE